MKLKTTRDENCVFNVRSCCHYNYECFVVGINKSLRFDSIGFSSFLSLFILWFVEFNKYCANSLGQRSQMQSSLKNTYI